MYASMTTVRGGGDDVGATARMAGESMLSWLREFDGYRGLVVIADEASGCARLMSLWDSREAAERSERGRSQVRTSMAAAAGVEIESVELYELVLEDRVRAGELSGS